MTEREAAMKLAGATKDGPIRFELRTFVGDEEVGLCVIEEGKKTLRKDRACTKGETIEADLGWVLEGLEIVEIFAVAGHLTGKDETRDN